MILRIAFFAGLAMLATTTHAAPGVALFGRTVQPLLYVVSAESSDLGAHYAKRSVFVYRDGTVLEARLDQFFSSQLPTIGSVVSGTASAARMSELSQALAAAKAGKLTDCFIDPPDAPLEWFFTFTWFGAGARTNTFSATQQNGPPACPPEVESLIEAVQSVVSSASAAASTRLTAP